MARLRSPLRKAFPLTLPPDALSGLPAADQRRLRLATRRSLDGLRALDAGRERVVAVASPADQAALGRAVDAWRAEQVQRFDLPGPTGETWVQDRLEHRFTVTADTPNQRVVLGAGEYPGGHLDWHAFDISATTRQDLPPQPGSQRVLDVLPVPLTYAGMPASSYWELEEGTVYFGGVEAGPSDLARLVVAEFATVYSNDWFLFPVRFPAGSIAAVVDVDVRNTFGESVDVRSAAQWDQEAVGGRRPWAFFELSGDESPARGQTPWLLLVPALAAAQHGPPLESVSFVRDEEANLVWAIEERIEIATGGSITRRLLSGRSSDAAPAPPEPAEGRSPDDAWRYRLQSPVPPWWIPLVPERPDEELPQVRLRRARMLAWEELEDPSVAGPKGRVLAPQRALVLQEEEVPATGAQVTRRWQLARGADGRPHLWMARRKRPGRGERGSGLGYDAMERP